MYSKLLLFGTAYGVGKQRTVGAYVVACSLDQTNSEAALWQSFGHLEEQGLAQALLEPTAKLFQ